MNALIITQQDADPTRVVLNGEITDITPAMINKGGPREVELKITNVRLEHVAPADVKVEIGGKKIELSAPPKAEGERTYTVKFMPPLQPPDPNEPKYTPILLVGKSEQRVLPKAGKILEYQD